MNMTSDEPLSEKKVQEFIEREYRKYYEAEAAAYLEDRDSDTEFLNGMSVDNLHQSGIEIPQSVLEACDFYNESCDDWGGAGIYQARIGSDIIYVVRVTTDGDDGWVEVFDTEGNQLAAGRTYIELVSWGSVEEIRQYVHDCGFPTELDDRQSRTLWQ